MKLVFIRHGDPNYELDTLTPTGWEEAEILSDRVCQMDVKAFYCSPLGRAKDTAKATMEKLGRTAEILPWLQEFPVKVRHTWKDAPHVIWDMLPRDMAAEPRYYDPDHWMEPPLFAEAGVPALYKEVCDQLDKLLAKNGYERNGLTYKAVAPNEDTLVFFCHFGLECVLLSHLIHVSPMVLWHGFCAAPTSITTVITEERREGIVSWRTCCFGDTSHLYAAGREPSTSARFCEMHSNPVIRIDC